PLAPAADPHDDDGRAAWRGSAGGELRRRHRDAPPARNLDRRRIDREPAAHALHHTGHLSLSRSRPACGWAVARTRARAQGRRVANGQIGAGRMINTRPLLLIACALVLAACAVGPNYKRPAVDAPASFKEAPEGWKIAEPQDAQTRTRWWEVFGDS